MNRGYAIVLGIYFVWLVGLFLVPHDSDYFGWYQTVPLLLPILFYATLRVLVVILRRFGL